MSLIQYREGDVTSPYCEGAKIIVHVCNDIGAWGKGFVLALSKRWAEPEENYRKWYRDREANDFELGAVQFVQVEDDLWIANLVGQKGIRRRGGGVPIRYEAVKAGLQIIAMKSKEMNASIHMPRIGCGLAGGRWELIEPILSETLLAQGVPVSVYDYAS